MPPETTATPAAAPTAPTPAPPAAPPPVAAPPAPALSPVAAQPVQTVAALPTAPPAPAAPAPTPAPAQPPAPAAPKTYTEGEYDAQTKALADANAQIAALKAGVTPDAAADVIALAASRLKEGTDINAAIAAVLTQYPHFKSASAPTAPPLVAAPGAPNPPGSAPSTEDPFLQGLRSK